MLMSQNDVIYVEKKHEKGDLNRIQINNKTL